MGYANLLQYNGITYVIRGSVNDDGTYSHYFYKSEIVKEYHIIYEGQKGMLTIKYTVYIDEETDQIITRDYYTWSMRYGYNSLSGVCFSEEDEAKIQDIIDNNSFIPDTPINSSIIDDGSTNLTGGLPTDEPTGGGDSDKDNQDKNKGLFDDTMGNKDDDYVRSSLPLGADIHDPDVLGMSIEDGDPPGLRDNNLYNKGTTYPIIRINDHYFTLEEILMFSMECGYYKDYTDYAKFKMPITGFLPTMRLIVRTQNPDLLKTNHIKQGDRCAVFFSAAHLLIKSMRCDFRITSAVSDEMDQNRFTYDTTYIIKGELYIPDLRNEELRYNFNGSSRDAMMDLAKRLRLSFFFCDAEDTEQDVMVWCNCKTPELFAHDLTTHAWKNAESFFESWIDPRYGLSFQNINHLLGERGFDEPLDATLWINAFVNHRNYISENEKDKVDGALAKILTNINNDPESATVFHINSWQYLNKAQEILDFMGLNCKMQYESVNPGLLETTEEATDGEGKEVKKMPKTNYSVEYSMCINRDKFDPDKTDNDFYVLLGPARNMTFAEGDSTMNVSETESSNKQEPEQITNPLSDGDAETILETDGNTMTSGNTHRFYEVAYEHNMRNLLLLLKQQIQVLLNGANISIVRGEKIPVLLADIDKANSLLYGNSLGNYELIGADSQEIIVSKETLSNIIYEAESGWYIIDGIEWVYDGHTTNTMGTNWYTNVKLTRREWPIPNKTIVANMADSLKKEVDLYYIDTNAGTIKLSKQDAYKYGYTDDDMYGPAEREVKGVGNFDDTILLEGVEVVGTAGTGTKYASNALNVPTPSLNSTGGSSNTGYGGNSDLTSNALNVPEPSLTGLPGVTLPGESGSDTGVLYDSGGATSSYAANFARDMYNQYITSNDIVGTSNVPLTGLKDYMKDIYKAIYEASEHRARLVSARRWAADEYGNKIDGNAFVVKNGYYKCMNAMGNVMYFKRNNSRHLYGEAIDIINDGMDFMELMTEVIMKDPEILKLMYNYGVSAYIEQAKDDTGVTTKHYHLGTDTVKQAEFWASVKAILGNDKIPGTLITFSNYVKNNIHAELEITRIDVDENSLNQ